MPKITLMPSGINGGLSSPGNGNPSPRGCTNGWSAGAARRNMRFLMSVDDEKVSPLGFVFTLTVRDSPPSSADWARMIDRTRKWLYRRGVIADHWVTEWQGRGAPHLHGVALFPPSASVRGVPFDLVQYWCDMTAHLGTLPRGQHWASMNGLIGWKRYVSKHAGRGYAHYQRQKGTLPEGWQKTGRMWGKGGDWPLQSSQFGTDRHTWFVFRRLVRSRLVAEARADLYKYTRLQQADKAQQALKRLRYLRGMLQPTGERINSEVRGLNEWIPVSEARALLRCAVSLTGGEAFDADTGEVL